MVIQANTQTPKTFTSDTTLQRTSQAVIYFTDDNSKGLNEWMQLNDEIPIATVPANTTWYFYCNSDASMAEVSV